MEILATFILLAGVVDDLRTQKVHNKLILILLAITVLFLAVILGPASFIPASMSFGLALLFGIPLVLIGVLGGGDMKLLAVFGLATDVSAVLGVAVYSVLWGALLGLVRALFSGEFKELILSTTQMLWTRGDAQKRFKIPYTVAMLFGWMTHLTLLKMGGSPW